MTACRKITFLTAGGRGIGLGHVRRTLALAAALRESGVASSFVIEGDARAIDPVREAGHDARLADGGLVAAAAALAPGSDALIADAYALTAGDFAALRDMAPLVVIDDLADRVITADIVVNAGAGAAAEPYASMHATLVLAGAEYAMLQPSLWAATPRVVDGPVGRILVTLGGATPAAHAIALAGAAHRRFTDAAIDIVVGPFASDEGIRVEAARVHRDPPGFLELARAADIAITGAGQTMYELAAIGTPAIAVSVAANQRPGVEAMAASKVLMYAGSLPSPGVTTAVEEALAGLASAQARQALARRSQALVDGQGARRVSRATLEFLACR